MIAIVEIIRIVKKIILNIVTLILKMKKYKILAVIVVVIYFLQSFFVPYGGIGADSLSYFGIAADFPKPETNLFPLGFPLMLKGFYFLFQDYFWSYKGLNLLFTLIILLFSWHKKFYFRETVLLFAGKTFFFAFTQAASESPFVFLFYFLIYFLHQLFTGSGSFYKNVVLASLMMIAMFSVRYSGIYIYLGIMFFFALCFFKITDKRLKHGFLLLLLFSGIGIGSYLIFNFLKFSSFTGENLRGAPGEMLPVYILRDLLGISNVIDPFIGLKPASNSFASLAFQFLILIIDIFIFVYFLKYYRKAKETSLHYFHVLLWAVAAVYSVSLLVSGWFQQIEEMNVRMLSAANFCLYFSFLILYFKYQKNDKLIWRTACFFLAFLTLYSLKTPANYLEKRNKVKAQMPKFKDKKYLFNNERNLKTLTTYHIPLIEKSFQYEHTNSQKGKLKESMAGSVNPKIKWLKKDTIRNKSEVLYTSELALD